MLLNIEKSGELDKEHSKEWLVNKNPNLAHYLTERMLRFNGQVISCLIHELFHGWDIELSDCYGISIARI